MLIPYYYDIFHFMFLNRYRSQITMFLERSWSHIRAFAKHIRSFGIVRPCVFQQTKTIFDSPNYEISKTVWNMLWGFLELFWITLWVQSSEQSVWEVVDTSQSPKLMQMMCFQVFPKRNRELSSPQWSRTNILSFRATRFLKLTINMAPQTPNSGSS